MPSCDDGALAPAQLDELARIAVDAVQRGLTADSAAQIDLRATSVALQEVGASFVTLKLRGALRGCIGSLERRRALAADVAANAHAAAFRDPRFPPLRAPELAGTTVEVSVLSLPRALTFDGADDLYAQLRPGIDGLVVEHGDRQATYLPSVWDMLPLPQQFVSELCRKAGIDPSVPLCAIHVSRYTTQHSDAVALA